MSVTTPHAAGTLDTPVRKPGQSLRPDPEIGIVYLVIVSSLVLAAVLMVVAYATGAQTDTGMRGVERAVPVQAPPAAPLPLGANVPG